MPTSRHVGYPVALGYLHPVRLDVIRDALQSRQAEILRITVFGGILRGSGAILRN